MRKRTQVPGHLVSTVSLSVPHMWRGGDGYGFETMVFEADGEEVTEWGELDCDRYRTEEEAIAGHESMVAKWRDGASDDTELSPLTEFAKALSAAAKEPSDD